MKVNEVIAPLSSVAELKNGSYYVTIREVALALSLDTRKVSLRTKLYCFAIKYH